MQTDNQVYTVSEISNRIKNAISGISQGGIKINGEVTNISLSKAGHLYFDLKDEKASISAALFKNNIVKIKLKQGIYELILHKLPTKPVALEQGASITVTGGLNTYVKASRYQIIIDTIIAEDKLGELHKRFIQLKERLEKEGLFEKIYKKQIPLYPSRIAILTSEHGAAFKDIKDVLSRFKLIKWELFPVLVQGEKASSDIILRLDQINSGYPQRYDFDLILLGRGGGSYEDLFCFNDESLVRAVFNSKVPVISAVGHERDITLCDFAADLMAITPTAAASMIIQNYLFAFESIDKTIKKIHSHAFRKINNLREKISYLSSSRIKTSLKNKIDNNRQYIDSLFYSKIEAACINSIKHKNMLINHILWHKINNLHQNIIKDKKHRIESLWSNILSRIEHKVNSFRIILNTRDPEDKMPTIMKNRIAKYRDKVNYCANTVKNLSPATLLKRGYSITFNENNEIIRQITPGMNGKTLMTQLYGGRVYSKATKAIKEKYDDQWT